MKCPECSTLLPDGSTVCTECGCTINEPDTVAFLYCSNCGAVMAPDEMACENCGARMDAEPSLPGNTPAPSVKKSAVSRLRQIPRKTWIIGAVIVTVILGILLTVELLPWGNRDPEIVIEGSYVTYLQNGELHCVPLSGGTEPQAITANLISIGSNSSYDMRRFAADMVDSVRLVNDGKMLFYPDDSTNNSGYLGSFTLYYRDLTDSQSEPVQIVSGISTYDVNEDGTIVTYLRDTYLYQHDLKDSTSIANRVSQYHVSDDGRYLVFLRRNESTQDYSLYVKEWGKEPVEIMNDVQRVLYTNKDFSAVFFETDDFALYRLRDYSELELVAPSSSQPVTFLNEDSLYYTTTEYKEYLSWEFIVKDLGKDYTGKYADNIEQIVSNLQDYYYCTQLTSLYYYDGTESTLLQSAVSNLDVLHASEADLFYTGPEMAWPPEYRLSEILSDMESQEMDYQDVRYFVSKALQEDELSSKAPYLAFGAESTRLDLGSYNQVYLLPDGKSGYVYYQNAIDMEYHNKGRDVIYQFTLNDGETELSYYDEDVDYSAVYGEHYVYIKALGSSRDGELYISGKKIDDEVYFDYEFLYCSETDALAYLTDYHTGKESGTLSLYQNGKVTDIMEDVDAMYFTSDGKLVFLQGYDEDDSIGKLYYYDGQNVILLAEDVSDIISVFG